MITKDDMGVAVRLIMYCGHTRNDILYIAICDYMCMWTHICKNIKVPMNCTDLRLSDVAKPPRRPSLMRIAQMTTSSALSRVSWQTWQIPNETQILRGTLF